jgi:hypothetical protein
LSENPDSYAVNSAGLDFIRMLPTSWDETRFLAGDVGDHVAIARRTGSRWYICVLGNSPGASFRNADRQAWIVIQSNDVAGRAAKRPRLVEPYC